jgi:uncharacterized protein
MQLKEAGEFIISKLSTELPPVLSYHNVAHTQDVYQAAERLGHEEQLSEAEMRLLLTAAWYHDSGYLHANADHERISCKIAAEVLPAFGYSDEDILAIQAIIMATRLPQTPTDHLGEILADADLDYLGRDDFEAISNKLYDELYQNGNVHSHDEWNRMQVGFLESHRYFTESARRDRKAKKEYNLQQIKAELQ